MCRPPGGHYHVGARGNDEGARSSRRRGSRPVPGHPRRRRRSLRLALPRVLPDGQPLPPRPHHAGDRTSAPGMGRLNQRLRAMVQPPPRPRRPPVPASGTGRSRSRPTRTCSPSCGTSPRTPSRAGLCARTARAGAGRAHRATAGLATPPPFLDVAWVRPQLRRDRVSRGRLPEPGAGGDCPRFGASDPRLAGAEQAVAGVAQAGQDVAVADSARGRPRPCRPPRRGGRRRRGRCPAGAATTHSRLDAHRAAGACTARAPPTTSRPVASIGSSTSTSRSARSPGSLQ